MKRLKWLLDPDGILNPGVVISDDPHAHLAHIKSMELIGDNLVDKCIECGFCEHVCPTRYVTLTPRQRIVSHRVALALDSADEDLRAAGLRHEYEYEGRDTCVADGMCSIPCPIGINTASLTDHDREQSTPGDMHHVMKTAAKHFHLVEDALRVGLDSGTVLDSIVGAGAMPWITRASAHLFPGFPQWSKTMGKAPKRVHNSPTSPDVIYFPSCVSRMMGSSQLGKASLMETVLEVGRRAGISVFLPKDAVGLCCSQIWEHTGFTEGYRVMADRLVEAMWKWTHGGRVPVMCDVTSCARTILKELDQTSFDPRGPVLSGQNRERYQRMTIIDIAEWLHDEVLPKLDVIAKKDSVVIHPTCACRELGLEGKILAIGTTCAREAYIPLSATCCGAGGDRGFLHPEDTASALHDESRELAGRKADGAYSFAKSCEVVLSDRLPYEYESIVYLVEETTEAKA
jgi:D-lactate dehydrogenase